MLHRMGRIGALVYACTRVRERNRRYDYFFALCIAFASLAIPTANADERETFDIPAGPAAESLNQYARQVGVEVGFPADVIGNVRTNAVKGEYRTDEALGVLLEGTGLVARHEGGGLIVSRGGPNTRKASEDASTKPAGPSEQVTRSRPDNRTELVSSGSGDHLPDDEKPLLEEILVTGTRIRGAEGASPVVTITRQEIDRAGYATVEDLVGKLPQNFGAGASADRFTDARGSSSVVGGNVGSLAGGSSINLRGLGTTSTLVLINGRRPSPSGLNARFIDVSSIPITAVERVEVLTDGASAIYGADAIGGVVNFILRDDYEGAETRLSIGSDTRADTSEALFGQSLGKSWKDGNLLAFYEYYRHDNLHNTDRPFAASTNLTSLGGTDWRTTGGNPANIVAGGLTFAIPVGQDGTSLTPEDFDPNRPHNRHDIRAGEDFLPKQERHSLFVSFAQTIADNAELFAEARLSTREHITQIDHGLISLEVPASNPYFVDPTGTGETSVVVSNYSFRDDLGPLQNEGHSDAYGTVLGANFPVLGTWRGELVGTYAEEKAKATFHNLVNRLALASALVAPHPESALNPFGEGSNSAIAVLESLRVGGNRDSTNNRLWTAAVSISGDAVRLPAGSAKLAAGLEYREESLRVSSIVGAEFENPTTGEGSDNRRDIFSAYAELHMPLIGENRDWRALRLLELTLAARYEDYNDFGDSFDPKVGIVWAPTQSLRFRGTLGTSFKAPGLTDLDTSNLNINSIVYFPQELVDRGLIPFPTIFMTGGNEDLVAEKATTWTAGFNWSPESLGGLSVDATYFNVDFEDRIEKPFTNLGLAYQERFAPLLNTSPTQEQIAAAVNDRRWEERFGVPAADVLSGLAPVGAIGDARTNNIASSIVTGVDLQLASGHDTPIGRLDLGLNANYLFDFKRALISTDPLTEEVDRLGRPVDFRARGSITWANAHWAVSGFVNYVDSYTDDVSVPARRVDSWLTSDLTVSYKTAPSSDDGLLGGVKVSLFVQNMLDEDPPFADTIGGLGYDSSNANGRGRFVTLQINKEW